MDVKSRIEAALPTLTAAYWRRHLWLHDPRLAKASVELDRLSRQMFGWSTKHASRWWEYPWVLGNIELPFQSRVLEVGAGTSPTPVALAKASHDVVVIDPETVPDESTGWQLSDYSRWGIPTLRYGMEDFPVELPFDGIVSVSVIEHVPAKVRRAGVERFAKSLRPGGILSITVDLHEGTRDLWNRDVDEVEPRSVHGTLDDLLDELTSAGFEITAMETCPLKSPDVDVVGIAAVRP